MGGTAAPAMDADHRITAGIDMDGILTYIDGSLMPVARHGLDRPFLLLGKNIGTSDPATAIRTNEAYVCAYFDHWLRHGVREVTVAPRSGAARGSGTRANGWERRSAPAGP
jgi:hypothetical protein